MEAWIKKSDAIKAIIEYADTYTFNSYNKGMHKAVSIIEAIPSADRPQGEWIDNGDRFFRCSLCGTKDTDRWHWCHGCGHPMKGADDE